jgi:hypothetical protein
LPGSCPAPPGAPKIDTFALWEVGDTAAYKSSLGPQAKAVEETVVDS